MILLSGRCEQPRPDTQGRATGATAGGGDRVSASHGQKLGRADESAPRGMLGQSRDDENALDASELHAEKSLTRLFLD